MAKATLFAVELSIETNNKYLEFLGEVMQSAFSHLPEAVRKELEQQKADQEKILQATQQFNKDYEDTKLSFRIELTATPKAKSATV